jgi:hypothetical protein
MNQDTTAENSTRTDLLEDDDLSMEGHDKPVKKARNVLFVLAGIQLVFGIIIAMQQYGIARIISMAIYIGVATVFFLLGLWTRHKPYTAIITALCIYGSLVLIDLIIDPVNILRGILIKIAVFALLISALSNAKEVQQWKDSLKNR